MSGGVRLVFFAILFATTGANAQNLPEPPPLQPAYDQNTDLTEEQITRVIVYYRDDDSPLGKSHPSRTGGLPQNNPTHDHDDEDARGDDDDEELASPPQSAFSNGVVLSLAQPMSVAQANAYAAQLEQDPQVHAVIVDRNVSRHDSIATNDSLFYLLWNMADGDPGGSKAEQVWPQGTGTGLTVAVLDTGMRGHPDMAGAWTLGYDLISDSGLAGDGTGRDPDPTDTLSCNNGSGVQAGTPHGLMVGSVIAARMNNNEGIAGAAPTTQIMPIRVLASCGGWLSDVLDGMRWAVGLPVSGLPTNTNPARVLNLSLGTTSPGVACSASVQAVVDEVLATGATIVVSTGNDGADAISVPAACQGVIAVTASSKAGNRASYGNAGAGTTLAAPGGGCAAGADPSCAASAYNYVPVASHDGSSGTYVMSAGTSFAAPHVAAAAALLLERNASRSPAAIKSALVNSARAFAPGGCDGGLCGAGMLDIDAALASSGFDVSAQINPANVRGGQNVTMTASTNGANSPVFTWRQLSGPTVSISAAGDGSVATFTAPQGPGSIQFEVTATETSGLSRVAQVGAPLSIAPELAPLDPISADPNTVVQQSVTLSDGSIPAAISVDAAAIANGVRVEDAKVIWTVPASGQYTIQVTPYDEIGSGIPAELDVLVKGSSLDGAGANPMGGGGGMLGLHGALALLLALVWGVRSGWIVTPRVSGAGLPLVLMTITTTLYAAGFTAVGAGSVVGPWIASLLHIDGQHLAANLIGLVLIHQIFGRWLNGNAWMICLLGIAPAVHLLGTQAGLFIWVGGLSVVLHALVGWAGARLLVDETTRGLGALVALGLTLKLAIDLIWPYQWVQSGQVIAEAAGSLHLMAAGLAMLVGSMLLQGQYPSRGDPVVR